MGVAIVAEIFVSAVVSKLASEVIVKVGTGLGMSESTAQILGAIGGVVAGGMTMESMSNAATISDAANGISEGAGLAAGGEQASQLAAQTAEFGQEGIDLTTASFSPGSTPLMSNPSAIQSSGKSTTSQITQPASQQQVTANTPQGSTALNNSNQVVNNSAPQGVAQSTPVVSAPPVNDPNAPWYDKLWNSEKTGDVLGGVASGMSGALLQGQTEKDIAEQKAEEDRRNEYSGNTKFPRLNQNFLSSNRPLMNRS